ncbi:phosphoglucosamine mutase [Peptostreptococcus canis]|uniref:Phosphoglucosamine mutase n=1 Tax=Peptostreptococcus canis TaxID=1159213 RepID=A0ABR6TI34_9FIRM|nr:phosphoglucosamine mutase [Peptostreptococcus canis]MBC2575084.1 phosphoglucosamine mutase [Peptostreptococcus canis]MBP1997742.1 phosphoglucosamine mutase [Peptostreptococcus canis]
MRKYFGTDGVRGIANTELTCELAYKLGRAGGYVLTDGKEKVSVVVGRDTRISGDMLESALISGLMSVGCNVITVGIVPTPAVAYLTRKYGADCGVVISASHNPVEFNGIKFFNKDGFKLADDVELEIEKYIDNIDAVDSHPVGDKVGKKMFMHDALKDYVEYITSHIKINFDGIKVVLDCANGAAYKVAPMAFRALGAEVVEMNCKPDGNNINYECGSTHPEGLQKKVVEVGADMGMAYDGDADRLIAVDGNGNIVDGDKIMIMSAINMKKKGMLKKDTLVVTVMSNIGLVIAAKENGISLSTTKVGDRYVLEEMIKEGYSLGGEQSGHLVFLDYNTTGDGTMSSLILASILQEEKMTLAKMSEVMDQYPQVLINVKVKNEFKNSYMDFEEISNEINRIEEEMNGKGRVLIRSSGTEPLVRVMLEGKDQEYIYSLAKGLANIIDEKIGC